MHDILSRPECIGELLVPLIHCPCIYILQSPTPHLCCDELSNPLVFHPVALILGGSVLNSCAEHGGDCLNRLLLGGIHLDLCVGGTGRVARHTRIHFGALGGCHIERGNPVETSAHSIRFWEPDPEFGGYFVFWLPKTDSANVGATGFTMTDTMNSTLPYQCAPMRCFVNAFVNSRHCYKDLKLKVKIGTMKWKDYYMYDEPRSVESVEKEWNKHKAFSAHCWLEDDEGNVYDYWTSEMVEGKNTKVEKMTKEQIRRKFNYEYVEFNKTIQTKIFLLIFKELKMWEEILQRKDAVVVYV